MKLKHNKSFSYAKYGYLFCIPFVIAFIVFNLYPTVYTIILGFTDCKGAGNTNWHILKDDIWKNYKLILNNQSFKDSVVTTLKIWIINFIPQIALALLLTAWFTSRRNRIKGQGFFKVVFYMPNIITMATMAILFANLFQFPKGPVNDILIGLGLRDEAFYFANSTVAEPLIVSFIQFFIWFGYTMIILISGVLGINPEIFEAAEIDGASNRQTFWRITLPNLRFILTYTLITSLIGGLTMYDIPKMLNDGQPAGSTTTMSVFIYKQAFAGSYMYNRASAASMLLFLGIAVCSAIVFFLMREKK